MLRIIMPMILLSLLTGCVPAVDVAPTDQALEQWIGRPLSEVVAAWGEPATYILLKGERQVSYLMSQHTATTRPANLPPGQESLVQADYPCRAVLTLDEAGQVTSADWVGTECRRLR